jgi:hypothetical protein
MYSGVAACLRCRHLKRRIKPQAFPRIPTSSWNEEIQLPFDIVGKKEARISLHDCCNRPLPSHSSDLNLHRGRRTCLLGRVSPASRALAYPSSKFLRGSLRAPPTQESFSTAVMASGDVVSEVKYLKRLPLYEQEKPFQLFIPIDKDAPDQRSTNLEFELEEQTFHDVRENAYDFALDTHGFQIHEKPTSLDLDAFEDRTVVESQYFKEVEDILKNIEGGYDRIKIFDWRVSKSASHKATKSVESTDTEYRSCGTRPRQCLGRRLT